MIVVSYGGGVNSTAMLVEGLNRGIRPDLILFADTGDERPGTYEYVEAFSEYLVSRGTQPIEVVRWIRKDGSFLSLGDWCKRGNTLPSKAFGMSGCTSKWKQQPLDKRVKNDPNTKAAWGRGELVERWIGYDAGEPGRAQRMLTKNPDGHLYRWRCPLVEWNMGREECEQVIAAADLPSPGKSSCYFCPSMRKGEIDQLGEQHPELLEKALAMEDRARPGLTSISGLGRSFSWRDYRKGKQTSCEVVDQDCGCYDGENPTQ